MSNWGTICGMKMRGPLVSVAGVVGNDPDVMKRMAQINQYWGAINPKCVNLEGRKCNDTPIIAYHSPFTLDNRVGLGNPGAKASLEILTETARFLESLGVIQIVSVFGRGVKDIKETVRIVHPAAKIIVLNASCSHVAHNGWAIGQDLVLLEEILRAILPFGVPVGVKTSPKMDPEAITRLCLALNVPLIIHGNTFGVVPAEMDGFPILVDAQTGATGGSMSGRELFYQHTLPFARKIRQISKDISLVVAGGISLGEHICECRKLDANAVGIGTATGGMSMPRIAEYSHTVFTDADAGTNNAAAYLDDFSNMQYRQMQVAEKRNLAPDLFLLRFAENLLAKPGQFVFVWLPRKEPDQKVFGERPFSIFDTHPLTLLVNVRGKCTSLLNQVKAGDCLYVRGPHGEVPDASGKILLVGGGTGVAALHLFAKNHRFQASVLLGAKDKAHLYDRPFMQHCTSVRSVTEDGSTRLSGFVTDHLDEALKTEDPVLCLACGPEKMVERVYQIALTRLPEERVLCTTDFLAGCGIGICSWCARKSGHRPDVDGVFMTKTQFGL